MEFISTRSNNVDASVPFETALLEGLAPDGGLYIPRSIPKIDKAKFSQCDSLPQLASIVLEAWLGDEIERNDLADIANDAFNFPIPLVELEGESGLKVLELFHGPTLSFKDVAARTMARLVDHFLKRSKRKLTVLVATSGDTGGAVADAFAGLENIQVVILFPKGKVSSIQELQLTLKRPRVSSLAVDGSFDDCQALVKSAFADKRFMKFNLSSANSINIGRLIPQSIYYHWLFKLTNWQPIDLVVPCGNLGNLTAGMLAAEMIDNYSPGFTAAHNANDSVPRFLAGKEIDVNTKATISNAMDVGMPSNLERMTSIFEIETLKSKLKAYSITDEETVTEMKYSQENYSYLPDPHTAVGLHVSRMQLGVSPGLVVLATAHPAKFPEVLQARLGIRSRDKRLENLEKMNHRTTTMSNKIDDLLQFLEANVNS